ncbi:protein HsdA [[Pasteurella] aerogenes]|nr:protein HsdA [[Pasteurella] aerogenes]
MKFKQYEFSDIAEYITTKIDITSIEQDKYISTDNMLANFGGVSIADSLPATERCNSFKKRDILFSNIRTYFKKVWFAGFDGGCSADVLVIRSKNEEIVLNEFLYLLICSEEFINFTIASSNGAKMPRGDKNAIKKYVFNIPNIEYQKQCIAQYFNLNKKIQLNTQINQTLEQIAQTIFKSWFIAFDPVHAKANALASGQTLEQATQAAMAVISGKNTQELHRLQTANPEQYQQLWEIAEAFPSGVDEEGVPRGWESKPLSDFGQIVCGKTPSKSKSEFYGNEIPFIKIPDMHNSVFTTKTADSLSRFGADSQKNKYIPRGSICVSCIATVGLVSIAARNSQTNQQINSIIPNNMIWSEYLYLALSQPFMKKKMVDLASGGSATLNMNTTTFSKIEIIKPDNTLIFKFWEKVYDLFQAIFYNDLENERLQVIRDELLPKLLSGEDIMNYEGRIRNLALTIYEEIKIANHYLQEWYVMCEEDNKTNGDVYKKHYFSIAFIKNAYLEKAILLLGKIFSGDDISLLKLRENTNNYLNNNGKELVDGLGKLKPEVQKIIDGIKTIRDKAIAHSDGINSMEKWYGEANVSKTDLDNLINHTLWFIEELMCKADIDLGKKLTLPYVKDMGIKQIYNCLSKNEDADFDMYINAF